MADVAERLLAQGVHRRRRAVADARRGGGGRARSRAVGAIAPDPRPRRPAAAAGGAREPVLDEQVGDVGDERRGQGEVALLVGAAIAEDELLGGPGDAGVEQVALAGQRVLGRRQAQAGGDRQLAAVLIGQERLARARASGTRPRSGRTRTRPGSGARGWPAARRAARHPARTGCPASTSRRSSTASSSAAARLLAQLLQLVERRDQRRERAGIELLGGTEYRRRRRDGARRTSCRPDGPARRSHPRPPAAGRSRRGPSRSRSRACSAVSRASRRISASSASANSIRSRRPGERSRSSRSSAEPASGASAHRARARTERPERRVGERDPVAARQRNPVAAEHAARSLERCEPASGTRRRPPRPARRPSAASSTSPATSSASASSPPASSSADHLARVDRARARTRTGGARRGAAPSRASGA